MQEIGHDDDLELWHFNCTDLHDFNFDLKLMSARQNHHHLLICSYKLKYTRISKEPTNLSCK